MDLSGVKRAPARTGEVCPNESEFGRLAAAIDEADRIEDHDEVMRLERCLYDRLRPSTDADRQWLLGQLARALANEWCEEAFMPLVRMVGDPLTVGCKL